MKFEQFKKDQKTLSSFFIMIGLLIFFAWVLLISSGLTKKVESTTIAFLGGMTGAICVSTLGAGVKMKNTLSNEEKLKEMYVKETDERNRYIKSKAIQYSYYVTLFMLALSSIVVKIFPNEGFSMIFATIIVSSSSKGLIKLYLEQKY